MKKSVHRIFAEFERHLEQGLNPADIIHLMERVGRIPADILPSILHRALVESDAYSYASINLPEPSAVSNDLLETASSQPGFESVIVCFQSEQQIQVINPSRPEHWKAAPPFAAGSLMVIYTRSVPRRNRDAERGFLEKFMADLEDRPGRRENAKAEGGFQSIRETPRYAVQVTNEFFHYGNVEAWQNIIVDYLKQHPDAKIRIFHRNKPIHKISRLFKWGKVSVGDVIHFSVTGSDFKNVAKLKKFLFLGASPRYLPFIKKHLHENLNLFA